MPCDQPHRRRKDADQVRPTIFHVAQQDQHRQVDDGLVEMEQEKGWLQMTKKKKTNNLRASQGRNISIDSHRFPLLTGARP
jgi:hypothetical protein